MKYYPISQPYPPPVFNSLFKLFFSFNLFFWPHKATQGMWKLSPLTKIKPVPPALEAESLNHVPPGNFPGYSFGRAILWNMTEKAFFMGPLEMRSFLWIGWDRIASCNLAICAVSWLYSLKSILYPPGKTSRKWDPHYLSIKSLGPSSYTFISKWINLTEGNLE